MRRIVRDGGLWYVIKNDAKLAKNTVAYFTLDEAREVMGSLPVEVIKPEVIKPVSKRKSK